MNEVTKANNLPQIFENSQFGRVRVVMRDGEPWFVAKDVCDILDLENGRDSVAKGLQDDEKGVDSIYTLGGNQEMTVISESGLYALVFKSRKENAQVFRKWVTSEVLPAIRKTGRYEVQETPEQKLIRFLKESQELLTYYEKKVAEQALQIEDLSEKLGDAAYWKKAKAIGWLGEYFVLTNISYSQIGKSLVKISKAMGYEVRKVEDSDYGFVNLYHIDVINALRKRLDADPEYLEKYRIYIQYVPASQLK